MKKIGVAVLGFGTVGAGVVDGLVRNAAHLRARTGIDIELRAIADLDITTDRGVAVPEGVLCTDAFATVARPDIDVVVETIGGCGVARKLVTAALEAGKAVVTANKKLLAEHGRELFALAVERGTDLYFGASVGGGIPVIRALREGLVGNRVRRIFGILNGTCNYILSRMEAEGVSFDTALAAAQKEGYAEADPTLDVDGFDTLHKIAILAALSSGHLPDVHALSVTGIRGVVDAADIRYAREMGYRIKLLGILRIEEGEVECRVAPTLVPVNSMLGSVNGVFNAALVSCDLSDDTLYYGRGAGRLPTASTVIGDIADVAYNRVHGCPLPAILAPVGDATPRLRAPGDVRTHHYLRLAMRDEAGSMAAVMEILARHGVSIESLLQKAGAAEPGAFVPVVVLTHEARQADIDAALAEIAALPSVGAAPVRLGVEK